MSRIKEEMGCAMNEPGVNAAFLLEESGFLVAERGGIPIDRTEFCALAAAYYGAVREIAGIMGESDFRVQIHRGSGFNIIFSRVEPRHVYILIVKRETCEESVTARAEESAKRIEAILAEESIEDIAFSFQTGGGELECGLENLIDLEPDE